VSELLILNEIFSALQERDEIDLKSLYHQLEEYLTLLPYLGDFESFKNIFFKLTKEGIIKATTDGDELIIESINNESEIRETIGQLFQTADEAMAFVDFQNKIETCNLNKFFLDEEEMKAVYFHLEAVNHGMYAGSTMGDPDDGKVFAPSSFETPSTFGDVVGQDGCSTAVPDDLEWPNATGTKAETVYIDSADARRDWASYEIQDFIAKNLIPGERLSIVHINELVHEFARLKRLDMPDAFELPDIYSILQNMIRNQRIAGTFDDQKHFIRSG